LIGVALFSIATLSCSFSALVGAFAGTRRRVLTVRQACLISLVSATLTIVLTWATGVYEAAQLPAGWPGVPWPTRLLPFLFVSWPAAYLLATARRQQSEEGEAA
jgi:hypothetical protein